MKRKLNCLRVLITLGFAIASQGVFATETLSGLAEQSQTAELNSNVSAANAAADERYRLLEAKYQEQKKLNDDLQAKSQVQDENLRQQYEDLRKSYMSLEEQYRQVTQRDDALAEQVQSLQMRYQEISRVGH